jgi:3-isopropylmalate dehydrogenase
VIKDVDFTIYRELSSGIYFGDKQELQEGGDSASDLCRYSVPEVTRVVRAAFKAARKRKGKLCVVDKANVLATSRLWRKTARDMAEEYPVVDVDFMYVDNAAMQLVLNPGQFDVIVTSNMFGDILSDLASTIGGSIGLLPSASIGTGPALFEPVHGSYPQAAGKDIANPIAMILSAAQMLDHFGFGEAADTVRHGVEYCLSKGIGTPDLHPEDEIGCAHFGDMVAVAVQDGEIQLKNHGTSTGVSTII